MKNDQTLTTADVITRHRQSMAQAQGVYHELVFVRGEGPYLYDPEGKRYIDMAVGICTGPVGHCHPEVVAAIKDQADRLVHTSMVGYYDANVRHAELLKSVAPPSLRDGRVLFLNSGSEGVEAALKMARMVTRRPSVISFMGAFHGRPMGALAATGSKSSYKKGLSGLMPGMYHAVYPYCYRCPMGHGGPDGCHLACINMVHKLLKHVVPAEDLAAIIIEPMAGENGYVMPPSAFIQELRHICDETGAMLIADEVQTGLGRLGTMWGCDLHGVEPDVIVFGKGAGGQMPLGGFIGKSDIVQQWPSGAHGSTYGGHPISCRAGRAAVEIIIRDGLPARVARLGKQARERFNSAKKELAAIGDVRGQGFMIGVELIKPDGSPDRDLTLAVRAEAGKRGAVVTNVADSTLRISPPLNIPEDVLNEGVGILINTIRDLS